MKRRQQRSPVLLSRDEFDLIVAALGGFQQAMEKAAHLSYGFTREKQRAAMIDHGIDAIELRNRICQEWKEPLHA